MPIDRKLLLKAYPDGCLAYRGVSTIEGWLCCGTSGPQDRVSMWVLDADWDEEPEVEQIIRGATDIEKLGTMLLPALDPTDRATWGYALADLALALGWKSTEAWGWEHWPDDGVWVLHGPDEKRHAFTVDTDDDAVALVMARIELWEAA